jgi:hypothetical protein
MQKFFGLLFLSLFSINCISQNIEYNLLLIPDSLKHNANAVIRNSELSISIPSQNSMTIKSKVVTTILNEYGLKNLDLYENYDKNRKITKIEAIIYDANGKEIKSYKKKDFRDTSVADGISIFNDNRALHLDYTPVNYPFTAVFETQVETSNTVFIPTWFPMSEYFVSTQNATVNISFNPNIKLNFKEVNLPNIQSLERKNTSSSITYSVKNLKAKKHEELAPNSLQIFPFVMFSLNSFSLEGINGNANSWDEMGKWFNDKILFDTSELPEETKIKIKSLVDQENDILKKAAIVYKFVQEKTRYVSIQEGIGGWKPMLAKDVDKLGYGDCKALTNYTKALLKEVGIESYYARLYGDQNKREIIKDIVSFQSNHVILAIPNQSDYVWLECTSQTLPFGFQGNFTDDRSAFIIKPNGGEIVKTKTYSEEENNKTIKGNYSISPEGSLSGKINIISKGLQYDNEYGKERLSREEQTKRYKEEFDNINNLSIKKINLSNDKNNIEFIEDIEVHAESYAQNTGGKLMFALNAFDQNSYVPKKYKTREFPFEIQRGYTNENETEITLPEGFVVEAKPNNHEINTEFGSYKTELKQLESNKIIYKRKLTLKKGFYENSKYENYRKFRETIARNDNSKILITKP